MVPGSLAFFEVRITSASYGVYRAKPLRIPETVSIRETFAQEYRRA